MTDVVLYRELESVSDKKIGIATLNSEKSLNALSLPMVESLLPQLTQWRDDPQIAAVILEGSGQKAFCAGGDIRDLYKAMAETPDDYADYVQSFFTHEYKLDYLIHTFGKPFMVWANGIVMGGGLGLMAGASHRIVTETSRIAMPEITIGLYPDVGGTYFLNHMPAGCGMFLGLTGASINATDAKHVNLADYFVSDARKQDVLDELLVTRWGDSGALNKKKLNDVLQKFENETRSAMPSGNIRNHQALIEDVTSHDSVEGIVNAILAVETEDKWLSRAKASLANGSPVTAHIVFRQLQKGESFSLADCFRLELGVSVQCGRHGEFAEGVRALLIEKDNNPAWKYASVEEVESSFIDELFSSPWSAEAHPLKDL